MNNNNCSLNRDHEVPLKRLKMVMNNSSRGDHLAEKQLTDRTRVLAALRRRVLHAGDIAVQFYEMKDQIDEIMREEERNLEMNRNVSSEVMRQIEVALDPSMCSPQEDLEAQASADAEMSQIKTRINVRITNLLTKTSKTHHSSNDDTPTFSKFQRNSTRAQNELRTAEKKVKVELSQMLEEEWMSQKFNCDQFEEVKTSVMKLHSEKVSHANEVGQDLQSSAPHETGSSIGNLVFADQMLSVREELKDVAKVEELMMILPEESEELSSILHCYGSMDSGSWSASVGNEKSSPLVPIVQPGAYQHSDNYNDSVSEVLDLSLSSFNKVDKTCKVKSSDQGLKLMVGNHCVLVSDPQFFSINWETHYTRRSSYDYVCNECSLGRCSRVRMKDHIWSTHYGGRFHCPRCPKTQSLKSRHGIRDHSKRSHLSSFSSRR